MVKPENKGENAIAAELKRPHAAELKTVGHLTEFKKVS
jgi:hypothetical protein